MSGFLAVFETTVRVDRAGRLGPTSSTLATERVDALGGICTGFVDRVEVGTEKKSR
jgi:hypothetical protein